MSDLRGRDGKDQVRLPLDHLTRQIPVLLATPRARPSLNQQVPALHIAEVP
jgi:hypothetical protein